jgi:hypothetical protein
VSDDRTSLLDDDHTRCLCDVGGDGYIAATAVAADGSTHLLLARVDAIGNSDVTYDPGCTDVAYEQLGALPPRWAARVALAPLRCGRRTKSGTPCRITVTEPNAACSWHRTSTHRKESA